MLPSSKRRLIGSRSNKSRQSPGDHNRRLLQQNRHIAAIRCAAKLVAYWTNNRQRLVLTLDGYAANDPKLTISGPLPILLFEPL